MELNETVERLAMAAEALEKVVAQQVAMAEERVGRIVAEAGREEELLRRLDEAEAKIAALAAGGRKTAVSMLAKAGGAVETVEAGAVDAALRSLSIEQRIAVKAELLRAGVL